MDTIINRAPSVSPLLVTSLVTCHIESMELCLADMYTIITLNARTLTSVTLGYVPDTDNDGEEPGVPPNDAMVDHHDETIATPANHRVLLPVLTTIHFGIATNRLLTMINAPILEQVRLTSDRVSLLSPHSLHGVNWGGRLRSFSADGGTRCHPRTLVNLCHARVVTGSLHQLRVVYVECAPVMAPAMTQIQSCQMVTNEPLVVLASPPSLLSSSGNYIINSLELLSSFLSVACVCVSIDHKQGNGDDQTEDERVYLVVEQLITRLLHLSLIHI